MKGKAGFYYGMSCPKTQSTKRNSAHVQNTLSVGVQGGDCHGAGRESFMLPGRL